MVERETFESHGNEYYSYFIKGVIRGKEIKIQVAPPNKDTDKNGYNVLDVVFGDAMVGSYLLALLLNTNVKGVKAFRVIYYLPCVMPAIVGGIVWSYIMRYDVTAENPGFFNTILLSLGLDQFKFFYAESFAAILSIVFMNLWSLGGGVIVWLAQFKNIPKQLYEAASIDGAGSVISFFKITLPLSTPMIFYNLITTFIVTLQFNGTLTFAPNQGFGYNNSVFMFGLKIYDEAFRRYNMGYACALAWLLVAAVGLCTIVVFKTDKWVQYAND